MSYRLMTVTRRRAARVVASAVGFLALTSSSGLASARAAETQISNSGQIGRLRIDASTGADITRLFGPPDYTTTGNIGQGAPPTPSFRLYGYHCATRQQVTSCAISYYVSLVTNKLESFMTTSAAFDLAGGVHVGMSATRAAAIERQPNIAGCAQGIRASTHRLVTYIATVGGHLGANGDVTGGTVSQLSVESQQHGVGVTLCL